MLESNSHCAGVVSGAQPTAVQANAINHNPAFLMASVWRWASYQTRERTMASTSRMYSRLSKKGRKRNPPPSPSPLRSS